MKNFYSKLLIPSFVFALVFSSQVSGAQGGCSKNRNKVVKCNNVVPITYEEPQNFQQRRGFCDVHNRKNCICLTKVKLGEPFRSFEMTDIYNQKWESSKMLGKPIIIITGHRSRRWEIGKWAECLNKDFRLTGMANILWVNDLMKSRYHTIRDEQYSMWRAFKAPVPVVMDWDGIVSLSLKVDYDKPNIIVIDQQGRLVMHEIKNFDNGVYSNIANCIKNLCISKPVLACNNSPCAYLPPIGCKTDSY